METISFPDGRISGATGRVLPPWRSQGSPLFHKGLRAVQPAHPSRVSLLAFTADFRLPSEPVTVCES